MSRASTWFQPGDGIDRQVITADIQRYLGPDATVRPGSENGVDGYYIKAYRTLTSEMIRDIKEDSARWRRERQAGVRYQDSQTHQARQHYGPSAPASSAPSVDHYPSGHHHQAPPGVTAGYPGSHGSHGRSSGSAPATSGSPMDPQAAMYARPPPQAPPGYVADPRYAAAYGAPPPPQPEYGQPGYYAAAPGQPPYGYPEPRTTPASASPYGAPDPSRAGVDPRAYAQDPRSAASYGYPAAGQPAPSRDPQYASPSGQYVDPYGRAYAAAPPSRDPSRTQAPPSANDARRRRY